MIVKKSDLVSAESIRKLLNIDNSSLHEKYIWIAAGLFVIGVLSACLFSLAVNYTVNLFVMIALIILFYMDWKLLDKHGKASFSKWWILFRQFILLNVVKAVGQGKMLLLVWLGSGLYMASGTLRSTVAKRCWNVQHARW
ncbi:Uncharacterised protein [Klebsiella michiganensis]|uniref:Uncharacterized protein n=1 Tax=Klebsiella michiganensis TaxID=1134687 RepID=A0A7H4PQF6_9ENTR|nr:Uncharacterised protein [Klebsiella michiganensis]